MQCPIVITPDGKLCSRHQATIKAWHNAPLPVTKYFMTQQDWDDIVKWGSGK